MTAASLLLENGATVNCQGASGDTALHAAAAASDLKLVWLLMGAGWDPATRNRHGATCLHLAGNARTTAYFAARARDIDARDDEGRTALMLAAAHGDQEKAKALLGHGASAKHADLNGDTALHAARTAEVAQVLLNAGADIETCASDGATSLIRYCQRSHPSPLIHTVLQAGASAATTDHRGHAALHYLIRQCARSTLFGRGDRYGEIMALSVANERSAASFAQTLIRHVREDPIARLESLPWQTRETFLAGHGGITLLLAHGASLEEEVGKPSLLSVAAERESSWAMLHLLEAGANPNHVDQNGETPLHVTRRKEARHQTFLVFDPPVSPSDILEAYGADSSRKNSQGRTPDDYKRVSIRRGLPDWVHSRPLWGRDEGNPVLPWERWNG